MKYDASWRSSMTNLPFELGLHDGTEALIARDRGELPPTIFTPYSRPENVAQYQTGLDLAAALWSLTNGDK